jgi:hypothetical protein
VTVDIDIEALPTPTRPVVHVSGSVFLGLPPFVAPGEAGITRIVANPAAAASAAVPRGPIAPPAPPLPAEAEMKVEVEKSDEYEDLTDALEVVDPWKYDDSADTDTENEIED